MRRTVRIAFFASMAAALGFLLSPLPNIELVTFTLFVGGCVLGWAGGSMAALLAVLLYFGFNPYGSSFLFPPLLLSQLVAGLLVAGLGAAFARLFSGRGWVRRLVLLPFAILAALAFPLLPSLGYAALGGGSWQGWLALGLLMTTWGVAFNIIIFMGSFEPLMRQMERMGEVRL